MHLIILTFHSIHHFNLLFNNINFRWKFPNFFYSASGAILSSWKIFVWEDFWYHCIFSAFQHFFLFHFLCTVLKTVCFFLLKFEYFRPKNICLSISHFELLLNLVGWRSSKADDVYRMNNRMNTNVWNVCVRSVNTNTELQIRLRSKLKELLWKEID